MTIDTTSLRLSACWFALVLLYLIGDVLRLYEKGEQAGWMDGQPMNQTMLFLAALLMLAPVVMALLSLLAPLKVVRISSVIVSVLLFLINAAGAMSYSSLYDRFLIIVGLLLNVLIVYLSVRGEGLFS